MDKTCQLIEWRKLRQGQAIENDLEEPNFKRRRTVSIDHKKDTDIQRNKSDDSTRYYGVKIYRDKDKVMRRFCEGHPISGFMMEGIDRLV